MVTDGNSSYHGNHFIMKCAIETNIVFQVKYTSIKKKLSINKRKPEFNIKNISLAPLALAFL